jgi:hypothetical protein
MYSLIWCVLYKSATIVYGKFLSLNKILIQAFLFCNVQPNKLCIFPNFIFGYIGAYFGFMYGIVNCLGLNKDKSQLVYFVVIFGER